MTAPWAGRVVQVYVEDDVVAQDPDANTNRPPKELKAFERVTLDAGETTQVQFELGHDSFSFYHPDKGWIIESGEFSVHVGSSSRDIRLTDTFAHAGSNSPESAAE